MLIGPSGPKLMPLPQSVTMIQAPHPMMQIGPAIYQPVPYAPASDVPVGNGARTAFITDTDELPSLMAAQTVRQTLSMPGEAVVPYEVSARSGGMIAMAGLEENSSSLIPLGLAALVIFFLLRKK